MTDARVHNRLAWDQLARKGIRWSQPASAEETANAPRGLGPVYGAVYCNASPKGMIAHKKLFMQLQAGLR